jgi:cyclophilin family peptidyl-prolyl cis-trans isomerase
MQGGRIVVLGLAAGLLASIAGCGSSGEGNAVEATPAAINGGGGTTPAAGTGSPVLAAAAGSLLPGKPTASDPNHPVVAIETSMGNITLTLDRQSAPLTVDNFLAYVDSGFYDQTVFHQVLKDYVILGGAFSPELAEKRPGYPVRNEARFSGKNLRGTIAMARQPDVIDSATCQFFINVSDNPMLDYKSEKAEEYGYCVFGQVTGGMEVVDRIADVQVRDRGEFERTPVEPVIIQSIRRAH